MSKNEDQASALNDFFKSLGEIDEEGQHWKDLFQLGDMSMRYLTDLIRNVFPDHNQQLYGSSVEDLKIYSPECMGDIDLLVYSGGKYVVEENMLEYSPNNPASVKIKADVPGHPMFETIVVEGIEYISALHAYPFVDFSVLGSLLLPQLFKAIASSIASDCPMPLEISSVHGNDTGRPAFTYDFAFMVESGSTLSRRLEELKQLNFQNLDPSELEFLPVVLCFLRRVDYTPQHAELFDDFVQHFKDKIQTLCSNPSGIIQGIPDFLQEIWYSDKAKDIRNRLYDIEKTPEIEDGSQPENNLDVAADENVKKSTKCSEQVDRLVSSADFADKVRLEQPLASEDSACENDVISNGAFKADLEGHEYIDENEIPQAEQFSDEGDICEDAIDLLFERLPILHQIVDKLSNWFSEDDVDALSHWLEEETARKDLFSFIGTLKPLDKLQSHRADEPQHCTKMAFSMDNVPALQVRGWPNVAREWINRSRKWPSPETIHRIIQEGFHLVVKHPKSGGCPETDFRLSFSHAEYLLSQELNDIQRQCYRGLKKYYSVYLRTDPKCLVKYHLKTLFLQTCEETGSEMWTEENRTACMMKLLENLHNALTTKYLRHFFITACNLFDVENIETPLVLDSLAVKVEQFMKNPVEISHELIIKGARRPGDVLPSATQQEITKLGNDEDGFREDLPKRDTKARENAAARDKENESSSCQEQAVEETVATANDIMQSARFHDLEKVYHKTYLKLFLIALENGSMESLEPLETSFVEGIKDLINTYNLDPGLLLVQLFDFKVWSAVYFEMILNSEVFTTMSLLAAMQKPIKIFKNTLSGSGVLGCPRDYSLYLPVNIGVSIQRRWKRILESMKQKPPKQSIGNMDDIPLD